MTKENPITQSIDWLVFMDAVERALKEKNS